ncbi:hypothetical protein [Nonomuraea sp. NPDC048901]
MPAGEAGQSHGDKVESTLVALVCSAWPGSMAGEVISFHLSR